MAHIQVPEGVPGIRALLAFRPETEGPLRELTQVLLHAPNSLSQADREIIAAYVSWLNDCTYCHRSHAAIAKTADAQTIESRIDRFAAMEPGLRCCCIWRSQSQYPAPCSTPSRGCCKTDPPGWLPDCFR